MDVNEYFKILAKNIKKFRKEKGINLRALSKLSGIRVEYLLKIENAQAKGMLLSHLEFLSKALNVKVSELLKDNINQVL